MVQSLQPMEYTPTLAVVVVVVDSPRLPFGTQIGVIIAVAVTQKNWGFLL